MKEETKEGGKGLFLGQITGSTEDYDGEDGASTICTGTGGHGSCVWVEWVKE